MPPRNARPCARPGCPNLATNRGRCPPCASELDTARNADRQAEIDLYRSGRWARTRRQVLLARPWCEEPRCSNPSTDVDHRERIAAILDAGRDPYDPVELAALCHPHHSRKTREEGLRPR